MPFSCNLAEPSPPSGWAGASDWAVDVALPVPLRRLFRYRLPPGMDPQLVRPGFRVQCLLGSRSLHGVTFCQAYPLKEASPKDRFLTRFEGEHPLLAPEIMELVQWMLHYYHAVPGELLRAVLPPGLLTGQSARWRLTPAGHAWLATHVNDPLAAALRLFSSPLGLEEWQRLSQGAGDFSRLRAWEAEGLLAGVGEGPQSAMPMVPCLSLSQETPQARSSQQAQILALLAEKPGLPRAALLQALPGTAAALNRLVLRGAVQVSQRPEFETLAQEDREGLLGTPHQLTPEQEAALLLLGQALDARRFESFLLFGVTGSGKTEVYLRAIQHCLDQNRQALFLVPEIALTPMMQERISARFGRRLAILHSAVGRKRRNQDWARVLAGKVDLVLGARSAVFAPLPRLGLVVVDEEHDGSYKQQEGCRYHARQVALVRARQAGAAIVLGSATPSLESWLNQKSGRHRLLTMANRATRASLPAVEIIDMREEFVRERKRSILSQPLLEALRICLQRGEQAMLLLNRRGFHSFLLCRKCGEAALCPHCSVSLTFHRHAELLRCHYCDYAQPPPTQCLNPLCQAERRFLQFFGEGTEQVEQLLSELLPGQVVDRLDRDSARTLSQAQGVLDRFREGQSHVLVGTQMIAKGHDFPNVTLVGILNADTGLRACDFRCAEWTFQLLTQVAGRSGRGHKAGKVLVQTYLPEHYSILSSARHDYASFVEQEMRYRKLLFYPPFSHMLLCMVQHRQEEQARADASILARACEPFRSRVTLLGPSAASPAKVRDVFRQQLLVKAGHRRLVAELAGTLLAASEAHGFASRVLLDIDPQSFS